MKYITFSEAASRLNNTKSAFDFVLMAQPAEEEKYQSQMFLQARSEDPAINDMVITVNKYGAPLFQTSELSRYPLYAALNAESEGWGMFESEGRWKLMRIDAAGVFLSDTDAMLFVAQQALKGSKGHRQALDMIGEKV